MYIFNKINSFILSLYCKVIILLFLYNSLINIYIFVVYLLGKMVEKTKATHYLLSR